MAMFLITSNKQSISAVRLQKLMGFGSIHTAMRWLRELRRAMGTVVEHHKLGMELEADESSISGRQEKKIGRAASPHRIVGVVERVKGGCGRVRLQYVNGYKDEDVRDFVASVATKGSMINTDGATAYRELAEMGYYLDSRVMSFSSGPNKGRPKKLANGTLAVTIHLPLIHRVFSLVKRVLLGAHQGRFSERHIQSYLDEYCFRFNRRNDPRPLALTQRLSEAIFGIKSVPYWKSSGRPYNKKPTEGQPVYTADQHKADRVQAWRKLGDLLGGTSGN
jgi:hypothetical protein